MQEKPINAPEEISIEGISSPIAQHILDFCNSEDAGDIFSLTDPPLSKSVISNPDLPEPEVQSPFPNFESFDPDTISALLNSPVRSEPQQVLPISYAHPENQFPVNEDPGIQFPMPNMSGLVPMQQQGQMQGEYNVTMQNSMFAQNIVPKNNVPEMQGYFGNNGNGYMSELDGIIDGLNVYNSPNQGQMRRIYSAGDMQIMQGNQNMMGLQENESTCFRVGKLTQEERKVKIDRYIRKRNERNFKKKIKYACRKTLADSRPRVRGRFAKNDEEEPRCMRSMSNESLDEEENSMSNDLETVKEDEDILDTSQLLADISGVNFNWSPEATWSI